MAPWSFLGLPGGLLGASFGLPEASWGSLLEASREPGKKNTYLKRIGFGTQKLVYIKSIFTLGHKEGKGTFSVAK